MLKKLGENAIALKVDVTKTLDVENMIKNNLKVFKDRYINSKCSYRYEAKAISRLI